MSLELKKCCATCAYCSLTVEITPDYYGDNTECFTCDENICYDVDSCCMFYEKSEDLYDNNYVSLVYPVDKYDYDNIYNEGKGVIPRKITLFKEGETIYLQGRETYNSMYLKCLITDIGEKETRFVVVDESHIPYGEEREVLRRLV